MRLKHFTFLFVVVLGFPRMLHAVQESTGTVETPGLQPSTLSEESEGQGVIPSDTDTSVSTQPVTPITDLVEKSPYEEAQSEVIRALALWNSGHFEAASDLALQAYEDYLALHRVPGVKRSKIRAETHQAAALYIESAIATIKQYVKQFGRTPEALEEAQSRLGDLKDVAQNYRELDKMLKTAMEQIAATPTKSAQ
jgi:hypothetical protein